MKLDKQKTQILQAQKQISATDLCNMAGITVQAYRRAMNTGSRTITIGKIA